jgi:hypothetical protein
VSQEALDRHRKVPVYVFYAITISDGDALLEVYATEEAARFRARQYVNQTYERYLKDWIMEYNAAVAYALLEHQEKIGVASRYVETF